MAIDYTNLSAGFASEDPLVQQKLAAMGAKSAAPIPTTPAPVPVANAPYPNDPATMRGARDNPLYLGPTNFSNIQKQYTPYQIEQATERNANGDIFWKQGVDISKIPVSPSGTTSFTAPATKPPLPSSQGTASGTTSMTSNAAGNELYKAQSAASSQYLDGLQKSIDDLLARQQSDATTAKAAAEAEVNKLTSRLTSTLDQTQYADKLKADRELFKTEQMIRDLGDVRTRIADATAALDQGIIFEESRPVRMGLLTGRSAELKKQGLAHIGALQSTAEIIKGNIDLARAYADDSLAAIKEDNSEKNRALGVLLDMANAKVTSLTADEKAAIKSRMDLLQEESKNIQKNKDDVFELAQKYPSAFGKSNVTFTDTREQALAKMMPNLAEYERLALEKERLTNEQLRSTIEENKAQAKKYLSGGGGSGSSSAPSAFDATVNNALVEMYANGENLEDVVATLQAHLGRPLDKKETDYVKALFATQRKEDPAEKPLTAAQLTGDYGIDITTRPELLNKTPTEIQAVLVKEKADAAAAAAKAAEPKSSWWSNSASAKIFNKAKEFLGFNK